MPPRCARGGRRSGAHRSASACAHATFIASALAGGGPDVLGLAPACPIFNIGVVDEEMLRGARAPKDEARRLAAAMDLATARGARVLQISLDVWFEGCEARPVLGAVASAVGRGAVVVVAAGHGERANPLLSAPGVVSVTGIDASGRALHALHRAPALTTSSLLAPAIDIPGAVLPDGTALRSGTSFAACFVTAAIALLSSVIPGANPRDAARMLLTSGAARRERSSVPLDADATLQPARFNREVTHVR